MAINASNIEDALGVTNAPQRESIQRLAKAVGVAAILASALSQEYGSGINFVLTSSLGTYPAVTYLVPLAMVAAGLLLLPKVILFMRFNLRFNPTFRRLSWSEAIVGRASTFAVGALAIIIAVGLLQSVLIVPKTPLAFQPSF